MAVALNPVLIELPSVSASYAGALRLFLQTRGFSASPTPAVARVAGTQFGDVLLRGSLALGDSLLGLGFGTRVGGAGFGLLGVAAATAPTLRESVRQLRRFEALTSTLGTMHPRRRGGRVTLVWQPVAPVAPAVIEGILAGWVSFGRYLLGQQAAVFEVSFAHPRSAALSAYEQTLDAPVRFDACEYGVTVPADLLDATPRFANPRVNAALGAWLDRCTAPVLACAERPVSRRVAAMLAQAPLAHGDEAAVARALSLGRRSLQRRLAAEGTSFRHLLDAARAQHAIQRVLRGGVPLADLAAELGFDEQSSLCRAFRRWTGSAPLALRQDLADVFSDLRAPAPPSMPQRLSTPT